MTEEADDETLALPCSDCGGSPCMCDAVAERAEADADLWRQYMAETRHQVEFRHDGWTVAHPLSERIDGSLFDCRVSFNHLDEPPDELGRFWIEADGSLTLVAEREAGT